MSLPKSCCVILSKTSLYTLLFRVEYFIGCIISKVYDLSKVWSIVECRLFSFCNIFTYIHFIVSKIKEKKNVRFINSKQKKKKLPSVSSQILKKKKIKLFYDIQRIRSLICGVIFFSFFIFIIKINCKEKKIS